MVAELAPRIEGATVEDVAALRNRDDILLFVRTPDADRLAVHAAFGARRARLTLTKRRFARAQFATGPLVDQLRSGLSGCRIVSVTTRAAEDGERCVSLAFDEPVRRLELELFGNRGLWVVCDSEGTIRDLARLPDVAGRCLKVGVVYEAPPSHTAPPAPEARSSEAPRFTAPVLESVDQHFSAIDIAEEAAAAHTQIERALKRHASKTENRAAGLRRQLDAMKGADELRVQADLMLAYGHSQPRGATSMEVPHPSGGETPLTLSLDPALPIHAQADRLYKKARKYADGRTHCEAQIAQAESAAAAAAALIERLEALPADDDGGAGLRALADDALAAGVTGIEDKAGGGQSGAAGGKKSSSGKPLGKKPGGRRAADPASVFRRFVSIEGLTILVGRNNRQNDQLSIRTAKGNDLWFHVGQGYAGSHVVVRLPKNTNASLETLIDASTLAVHYSKVRGAELCEVIHTRAKNVSKPKGLPPGRVVATQTKALRIKLEAARLERLLATGGADA